MAQKAEPEILHVGGHELSVSNPGKLYFKDAGITKLELVRYYLHVGEGALRGIYDRPIVLKRYVHGADGDFFFQKRAPAKRPKWVKAVTLSFPSGRTADEIVVTELAQLGWIVNLGCIDLNPHPVRSDDLEHPDELRVDLDPGPGVAWDSVRKVALVVQEVLEAHDLVGWPKTSGSRGIHVNVRILRKWSFDQVRRAALALAREVERRAPEIATSKWWKEERHGVFLDYNQNAKDRTVASAYSVRPVPDARVSAPLRWDEVASCELGDFTLKTMPARYDELGELHAGIDEAAGSLEPLLELSARHEAEGQGDAPWPPHYQKHEGEPPRVQPSRRKKSAKKRATKRSASKKRATRKTDSDDETGPRRGRRSKMPLITIARAARKEDALAGLERWKQKHPDAAQQLAEEDVLIDAMRGRSTTWTRIRVNLRNVAEAERPAEVAPDPDYDPWRKT